MKFLLIDIESSEVVEYFLVGEGEGMERFRGGVGIAGIIFFFTIIGLDILGDGSRFI